MAAKLAADAPGRKPPARLFFFTDPQRTPDPAAVAACLPEGAAVVYRAFSAPDALEGAQRLRAVTRQRGCLLLVGADEALAAACEADGLHLPERDLGRAPWLRRDRPGWILTGAAHSQAALHQSADLDAAMVSPVFESRSASAGEPLGVERLRLWARASAAPVIALGGVDADTAPRLLGSGIAGLAAVEAWLRS